MFRKIHYFGCSYTYGAGLKDRYKERFSYHLSQLFGAPHKNYGIPGSSDYQSLYAMMRLQCNNYIQSDDLVVFQWTQPHRHPIPLASEEPEWQPDAAFKFSEKGRLVNYPFYEMHKPSSFDREQRYFLKSYISFIDPQAHYMFNNQVLKELLDGWAHSRGVELIQFMSHPFHDGLPISNSWTNETMQQFLDNHGFETDLPCGHPSAAGHKRWAEQLYFLHQHRFRNPLI